MKIFVETPRLLLREVVESDVDGFFQLDSDPEVHRYLGGHTVKSKEESLVIIKFVRQQYDDHGIGRWAVIDKKTGTFMGWAGLKYVTEEINNHKNYYDLGYRLIRKFWGQGYGHEVASASLMYAVDELSLGSVFASAHKNNVASNRIIRKLGFVFKNEFTFDQADHNWYEFRS